MKWAEYVDACSTASNGRITLVPGIEYGDEEDVVHIPVWGRVPFFGEAPPIGNLLAQVAEAGGTAVWAHPWRRDAWRRADPSWYNQLGAVEVWNRKYDGIAPSSFCVELSRRHEMQAWVALDFHTRRQLFPLWLNLELNGRVEPALESVTPDAVLRGTRCRAVFASCARASAALADGRRTRPGTADLRKGPPHRGTYGQVT